MESLSRARAGLKIPDIPTYTRMRAPKSANLKVRAPFPEISPAWVSQARIFLEQTNK